MYRFLIPKSLISLTKGSFAGEGTKCIFSYNRVTCTQKNPYNCVKYGCFYSCRFLDGAVPKNY